MHKKTLPGIKPLIACFFLMVLVSAVLCAFVLYTVDEIAGFSDKLYHHPLTVSNEVRRIKANVNAMHRSMKDAVIASTPAELAASLHAVMELEEDSLRALELIERRFLGDAAQVRAVKRDFVAWRTIRAEAIALKQQNRPQAAAQITKTKGMAQIAIINRGADGRAGLDHLLRFAEAKASEFRQEARKHGQRVRYEMLAVFVCVLVAVGVVAVLFRRSIQLSYRLQESEEQFRVLFDSSADEIFVCDIDGAILDVNQRACAALGYCRDELRAMQVRQIDLKVQEVEAFRSDVLSRMHLGQTVTIDGLQRRKDGTTFPVEVSLSLVDFRGRRRIIATARNVTERRLSEAQLRQSQKMDSIGTLAGGIAHDFNNILGGIIGYTELAQYELPRTSPAQEYLRQVLKSTARAKDLVRQILTFSRKGQEERHPVQLSLIVKEAAKLLRSTIPAHIEITQRIEAAVEMVDADATQMHQIVMNLCANAAHAMQETGGELEIALVPRVITPEQVERYDDIVSGPYVELRVSDTGTGIDPKIMHRIFEPFFTTKEQGRGTGMGLAVVHGIVKDHGGDITVESQPGRGTTVSVVLPQVIGEPELAGDAPPAVRGGTEHILFVDDEKMLTDLGQRMLSSLGYRVTAVNSSIEALERFEQAPDAFDLVISDQAMPHMTGYNLATRILSIRPSARVIVCTGYSDTITPEKAAAAGIRALLHKPVTRDKIARAIRDVLDDTSA